MKLFLIVLIIAVIAIFTGSWIFGGISWFFDLLSNGFKFMEESFNFFGWNNGILV